MDKELLMCFLELQSRLLFLSFSLYEKDRLLFSAHPLTPDCDITGAWLNQIPIQEELPTYTLTKELLLLGRIPLCGSDLTVIAGPVAIGTINTRRLHDIILSAESTLKVSDSEKIMTYLEYVSRNISFEKFLPILHHLFEFINRKRLGSSSAYESFSSACTNAEKDMALEEQKHIFAEKPRRNTYQFERELLFYVRHGMPEKLRAMPMNYGELPSLAGEPLRHYKNALIILNSMCQRAAISGGLEPETCYQLGEVYIHKIEACKSIRELNDLSALAVDYSSRVAEIAYPRTDNEKINKAMYYIKINYPQKLTVGMVADYAGLSKEYLSSKFHRELKITLPDYINQQKIMEAKRLLLFSNMTLSEITDFLSFSSQSYFHAVFKKVTGITPSEYKRSAADL